MQELLQRLSNFEEVCFEKGKDIEITPTDFTQGDFKFFHCWVKNKLYLLPCHHTFDKDKHGGYPTLPEFLFLMNQGTTHWCYAMPRFDLLVILSQSVKSTLGKR